MSMAVKYAMKKRMAKGGEVKGVHKPTHLTRLPNGAPSGKIGPEHFKDTGESKAGERLDAGRRDDVRAEHHRVLSEMHSMRGKDRTNLAKGGEVGCQACEGGMCYLHGGMVDKIMMARGGMVEEPVADFEGNDFDYLHEESTPDDADYTGANSGDMLGNEQVADDEHDLISMIMRSRSKKDHMPRPA